MEPACCVLAFVDKQFVQGLAHRLRSLQRMDAHCFAGQMACSCENCTHMQIALCRWKPKSAWMLQHGQTWKQLSVAQMRVNLMMTLALQQSKATKLQWHSWQVLMVVFRNLHFVKFGSQIGWWVGRTQSLARTSLMDIWLTQVIQSADNVKNEQVTTPCMTKWLFSWDAPTCLAVNFLDVPLSENNFEQLSECSHFAFCTICFLWVHSFSLLKLWMLKKNGCDKLLLQLASSGGLQLISWRKGPEDDPLQQEEVIDDAHHTRCNFSVANLLRAAGLPRCHIRQGWRRRFRVDRILSCSSTPSAFRFTIYSELSKSEALPAVPPAFDSNRVVWFRKVTRQKALWTCPRRDSPSFFDKNNGTCTHGGIYILSHSTIPNSKYCFLHSLPVRLLVGN